MNGDTVKTICPMCFKVFSVSEGIERVRCNFCNHDYDLPRFSARYSRKDDSWRRK